MEESNVLLCTTPRLPVMSSSREVGVPVVWATEENVQTYNMPASLKYPQLQAQLLLAVRDNPVNEKYFKVRNNKLLLQPKLPNEKPENIDNATAFQISLNGGFFVAQVSNKSQKLPGLAQPFAPSAREAVENEILTTDREENANKPKNQGTCHYFRGLFVW
jgi:hypothetical protein